MLPLRLRARRLYILPTRAGLAFAGIAAVTFIAGMNYGSGLAMLLCFWLAGFLITAMLQTHRGMAGMQVLTCHAPPAFAGSEIRLELNLAGSPPGTGLMLQGAGAAPAFGITQLTLRFPVQRRGVWQPPPLELSTRSPFGLFRCWTWLQLPIETEVYPLPVGTRPPPQLPGSETGNEQAAGLDELTWLRPFRDGDSPRQVAWKAYARGTPLLVREYRGAGRSTRELRFDALPGLDTEQRLSQLARWIVDAAARREHYQLVLPRQAPLQGSDALHRERCLGALARF
ncbi:MAG: DUF58 domain-containing protein [Steroidobacteraceae bacterium]